MRPLKFERLTHIKKTANMKSKLLLHTAFGMLTLSCSFAQGAVVFSEINLTNNTITLTNTDASAVDLGGWRFCSHDFDSARVYSSASHFNGVSIAAGESLVIDTTTIPFAGLLDGSILSVGLYNDLDGALSFGSANDLSAFVQFSPIGTTNVGSAETRTGTAVAAGLWDAPGSFVELGAGDSIIRLNDLNVSTGASSFSVVPEPSSVMLSALGLGFGLFRRKVKR